MRYRLSPSPPGRAAACVAASLPQSTGRRPRSRTRPPALPAPIRPRPYLYCLSQPGRARQAQVAPVAGAPRTPRCRAGSAPDAPDPDPRPLHRPQDLPQLRCHHQRRRLREPVALPACRAGRRPPHRPPRSSSRRKMTSLPTRHPAPAKADDAPHLPRLVVA